MKITERLEKLEKQNRRLRAGFAAIALTATGALLMGARSDEIMDVSRARRFEVVAANGQMLAVLGQDDGQGNLALLDAAGNWKVQLHALLAGGTVTLKNTGGQALVRLGFDGDGNGAVRTSTRDGASLVALSSSEGGRGAVTTFGADGQELVTLSTTQGGSGAVTTFDPAGHRLVGITATTTGQGVIAAYDTNGRVRKSWP